MKKYKLYGLFLLLNFLTGVAFGQSGFFNAGSTGVVIKSGTVFSVDSLVLTPAADYTIAGGNAVTKGITPDFPNANITIRRTFLFTTPTDPFTGTVGIYYRDDELNNLPENELALRVYTNNNWQTYTTNVLRNAPSNSVTTTVSNLTITELTLAKECLTKTMYYQDGDGDGYGNEAVSVQACSAPAGYVTDHTDCNDADAAVHVPIAYYRDSDGDGFGDPAVVLNACSTTPPVGYVTNREDCDDTHKTYEDADGDGYGSTTLVRCGVDSNTDCDDTNADLNPSDFDGDGVTSCAGDCDDYNRNIYPGAPEICDGKDNDCDGQIDEGLTIFTYNRDADGDGFGNPAISVQGCSAPQGYVNNAGDCNDANAGIHPGATEICGNGIDDDCDGQVDEGCSLIPYININSSTVYESQGQVTLAVSLSKANNKKITVNYTTVDGTAVSKGKGKTPAIDFVAQKGTLTIPAGSLQAKIAIKIVNDNLVEGAEQFTVQLSKPTGATLGTSTGTVTILNGAPAGITTVTVNNQAAKGKVTEAAPSLTVTALPNPSTQYFTLITRSASAAPLVLVVTDNLGRTIETKTGLAANGTLRLGQQYRPGLYLVAILQGNQKTVLKLVRTAD